VRTHHDQRSTAIIAFIPVVGFAVGAEVTGVIGFAVGAVKNEVISGVCEHIMIKEVLL
jgi:hypothetical protein